MKVPPLVVFFAVFFTIYGLVNFYIFLRGWQALPVESGWRTPYLILFLFLSTAFIVGRFLERAWISPVSASFIWVGSFWLAAMLYFVLFLAVLDLLRLVNHFIPFYPRSIGADYQSVTQWLAIGATALVALILLVGHVNALHPRVALVRVNVNKPLAHRFTIAMASDIHLGTIIGNGRLGGIIGMLNAQNADVILLPGDVVDEDVATVVRENMGDQLRMLKARQGVFAVTGNHEYIGGVEQAVAYLREHGITILRDSSVVLPDGITLIGREDRSAGRMRKPLAALMAGVDMSRPVIVMDHQPFHLEEAEQAGVDLQVSGHTHHGQLWPFNYITNALYEVSWGFLKKGETSFYVSSGVGTWGPPVRLGNRPEIVRIEIEGIEQR